MMLISESSFCVFMFKVADLRVRSELSHKKQILTVDIQPGPKDILINAITIILAVIFVWNSFSDSLWMVFVAMSGALYYSYSALEDHVHVRLDQRDRTVCVIQSKLGRRLREFQVSLKDFEGAEIAEKDLHMNGRKAHRVELRFRRGFRLPLSKGWAVNESVVNRLSQLQQELNDFLGDYLTNGQSMRDLTDDYDDDEDIWDDGEGVGGVTLVDDSQVVLRRRILSE
jgi:hypothetical protein